MLRKHRSLILFTLICVPFAAAFCAAWSVATGQYRPPLWATVVAAVVTALVADQLEMALSSYLDRRAHNKATDSTDPDKTTEGAA